MAAPNNNLNCIGGQVFGYHIRLLVWARFHGTVPFKDQTADVLRFNLQALPATDRELIARMEQKMHAKLAVIWGTE